MAQHKWTADEIAEGCVLLDEMGSTSAARFLSNKWGREVSPGSLRDAIRRAYAVSEVRGEPDTVAHIEPAEVAPLPDVDPQEEEDSEELPPEPPPRLEDAASVLVSPAGELRRFAAVGDIHFGSKHHLGAYFQDFCGVAYTLGVRTFLHVGDLLDGVYRHSRWEQEAHGFDEQVDMAISCLPQWPDARWFFIDGNHDETFQEGAGFVVGRAVEERFRAAGRTDMHYLGARGAYVRLAAPGERRGVFVELWHPRSKVAYAKSYHLQKHIEGYGPGQKPDFLLAGHWHNTVHLPDIRGVHAFSCGAWQGGQSSFGRSIGGCPAVGSWIVSYTTTSEGAVRDVNAHWRGYHEVERVRDVALG